MNFTISSWIFVVSQSEQKCNTFLLSYFNFWSCRRNMWFLPKCVANQRIDRTPTYVFTPNKHMIFEVQMKCDSANPMVKIWFSTPRLRGLRLYVRYDPEVKGCVNPGVSICVSEGWLCIYCVSFAPSSNNDVKALRTYSIWNAVPTSSFFWQSIKAVSFFQNQKPV